MELLKTIPDSVIQLVVTSPPYNIGKEYEKRLGLGRYVDQQRSVNRECVRVLLQSGRICWQVGNYVDSGSIVPRDTVLYPVFSELGLRIRNRVVWHFEHGLQTDDQASNRYVLFKKAPRRIASKKSNSGWRFRRHPSRT